MRATLLLATLIVAATAATLAPTAGASACANEDPVDDVECYADQAVDAAECLTTRPPMHWYRCRIQL